MNTTSRTPTLLQKLNQAVQHSAVTLSERGSGVWSRQNAFVAVLIMMAALVLYGWSAPNAVINGDAALAGEQISNGELDALPIHSGYYVMAFPFLRLSPLAVDKTLNLLNCLFGALTLGVVYQLTWLLTRNTIAALFAAGLLGVNYLFVLNSVFAEVYAAQTFFLLLAFRLWLSSRSLAAGIAFTISFLVTPTTILALPSFLLLRPHKEPLLRFLFVFVFFSVIVLAPYGQEYLYGERGILAGVTRTFVLETAALKEARELFYGVLMALPFVLAGVMVVAFDKSLRLLGAATFCLWLLTFRFAETTNDVPAQLPTYALLCVLAGIGTTIFVSHRARESWNRVIVLTLIGTIGLTVLTILFSARSALFSPKMQIVYFVVNVVFLILVLASTKFAPKLRLLGVLVLAGMVLTANAYQTFLTTHTAILRETNTRAQYNILAHNARPDYIVLGSYETGMRFLHYVLGARAKDRWINSSALRGRGSGGTNAQTQALAQWQKSVTAGREIWVLINQTEMTPWFEQAHYKLEPIGEIYRAYPAAP